MHHGRGHKSAVRCVLCFHMGLTQGIKTTNRGYLQGIKRVWEHKHLEDIGERVATLHRDARDTPLQRVARGLKSFKIKEIGYDSKILNIGWGKLKIGGHLEIDVLRKIPLEF